MLRPIPFRSYFADFNENHLDGVHTDDGAARNQVIEKDRVESLSTAASESLGPRRCRQRLKRRRRGGSYSQKLPTVAFADDWSTPQAWKPKNFVAFPSPTPRRMLR